MNVEAVPTPAVPLVEIKSDQPAGESVARSGEMLRQSEWCDELLTSGIRGKKGQYILSLLARRAVARNALATEEAETKTSDQGAEKIKDQEGLYGKRQRVMISYGPEHAPLEQKQKALTFRLYSSYFPRRVKLH